MTMMQVSRREALGLGALLAVPGRARAQTPARSGVDFALNLMAIKGNVLAMDDRQPRAEAFAIKDGRFIAVGSTADIRNLANRRTRFIAPHAVDPDTLEDIQIVRTVVGGKTVYSRA